MDGDGQWKTLEAQSKANLRGQKKASEMTSLGPHLQQKSDAGLCVNAHMQDAQRMTAFVTMCKQVLAECNPDCFLPASMLPGILHCMPICPCEQAGYCGPGLLLMQLT